MLASALVRLRLPIARIRGTIVSLHWSLIPFGMVVVTWGHWPYGRLLFAGYELACLFGIVLLHEFGHVVAARLLSRPAREVVLWPLGGLAMTEPPGRWQDDLLVAAAGPTVNAALVPVAVVVHWFAGHGRTADFSLLASRLAGLNIGLLLLNLLPVFPLDGGRIAHALAIGRWGQGRGTLRAAVASTAVSAIAVATFVAIERADLTLLILGLVPVSVLYLRWALWLRTFDRDHHRIEGARCPRCRETAVDQVSDCEHCYNGASSWRNDGRCCLCGQVLLTVQCPFCGTISQRSEWVVDIAALDRHNQSELTPPTPIAPPTEDGYGLVAKPRFDRWAAKRRSMERL